MKDKIIQQIKTVFDPEIPVDVYELGLIYDIKIHDASCFILMTLTTMWCPEAEVIPERVKQAALNAEGIKECEVEVTFDPPWSVEHMSEAARLETGLL